ncbi:MAG: 5'/3'-nucleotidase SurE [Treponema sp.]|jgi:5'-nucleotidase|nr:5'/3'-nucleotidase SurE [Treponema sp.]
MRVLLTNDDGISSPGLNLLAKALRGAGHRVFIVAPDINRSGSSHSIEFLNEPIVLKQVEEDTWACSGTPVDCVIVGLLGGVGEINIKTKDNVMDYKNGPDMVLSGINVGSNLGTDIVYSGTAAAARQSSIFGVPSAALSLVDAKEWHWEPVVEYITENLSLIMNFWEEGTFINVNFPNNGKKPDALVTAFPSLRYYDDSIETYPAPDGKLYCFTNAGKVGNTPAEGSDWAEVRKNNAALSVVMVQPASKNGRN